MKFKLNICPLWSLVCFPPQGVLAQCAVCTLSTHSLPQCLSASLANSFATSRCFFLSSLFFLFPFLSSFSTCLTRTRFAPLLSLRPFVLLQQRCPTSKVVPSWMNEWVSVFFFINTIRPCLLAWAQIKVIKDSSTEMEKKENDQFFKSIGISVLLCTIRILVHYHYMDSVWFHAHRHKIVVLQSISFLYSHITITFDLLLTLPIIFVYLIN